MSYLNALVMFIIRCYTILLWSLSCSSHILTITLPCHTKVCKSAQCTVWVTRMQTESATRQCCNFSSVWFQLLVSWLVHSVWRSPTMAVILAACKHEPSTMLSQSATCWLEQSLGKIGHYVKSHSNSNNYLLNNTTVWCWRYMFVASFSLKREHC